MSVGLVPFATFQLDPGADVRADILEPSLSANSGLMQGSKDGCRNPLLNHLVSAGEQRGWDVEAERLRSFEIDG